MDKTDQIFKMIIRKVLITYLLVAMMILSCSKKKLNTRVVENDEIKLEFYQISEISNIHEYIEITNKRWNKSEKIYEGESGQLVDFMIKHDTIFLDISTNSIIYDLSAIKFNYKIVLREKKEKH